MARTIAITIEDADTGLAVATATVTVLDAADAALSTGSTDVNGLYTSDAQLAATAYYITVTKTGYLPYTKAGGLYFQSKLHWVSPTADEIQTVGILLQPDRARSQCVVYEGAGASSGAAQTPVDSATVLVKKTSDNTLLETLTTDADGVAFLDESSYGAVAHYCTVSKALYNSNTVYRGQYEIGQSFAVPLQLTIAHTTKEFKLHLIDSEGSPVVAKTLYLDVMAMHSMTDGGEEYFVKTGEKISLTTDANGTATADLVENLMVSPTTGWAAYFGYPEKIIWVMSGDVVLGDGTPGTI